MYIIYIILGILAIIIAFQQVKNEKFSPVFKLSMLVSFLFLIAVFYFMEQENQAYQEKINKISVAFEQNKTLECKLTKSDNSIESIKIHREKFNLTSNSFLGKKNSESQGLIISLSELEDCQAN
jgi:hypothetical protein